MLFQNKNEQPQPDSPADSDEDLAQLESASKRKRGRSVAAVALTATTLLGGVTAALTHQDSNPKTRTKIEQEVKTQGQVTPVQEAAPITTSTTEAPTTTTHANTVIASRPKTTTSQEVMHGPRPIESLPGFGKKVAEADKLNLQRATYRGWIKAKDGSEPNRAWGLIVLANANGRSGIGFSSAHLNDIAMGVQDPSPDGANIQKEYVWQTSAGNNSGEPAQDLSDKNSPYEITIHDLDDKDGSQPLAVVTHFAEDTSGKRNELSLMSFDHVTVDMGNRALKGIKLGTPEPGEEVYTYGQATPFDAKQSISMFAVGESFNDWAIPPAGPQQLYNTAIPRGNDLMKPGFSGACGISASGVLVGGLRGVAHPGEDDHIPKAQQATNVDLLSGNKYDVGQFGVLDPDSVRNQLAVI